jgi:hypothetical protein
VPGAAGGPASACGTALPTQDESARAEATYIWQFFLPRLPFMNDRFPGTMPLRVTWFDGFIGRFGWLDYAFPQWVTDNATWIAYALLIAALVAVVRLRGVIRERWAELAVCVLGLVGVAAAIGHQQFRAMIDAAPALTQARYLLPLLALYGALVAVAARGFGRRAMPAVAVVLFGLAVLHEVSAMILTVARYYA